MTGRFVESLVFDMESYFDTGIKGSSDLEIIAKFINATSGIGIYGTFETDKNISAYLNGNFRFGANAHYIATQHNQVHEVVQNIDGLTFDGVFYPHEDKSDFTSTHTLWVGAISNSSYIKLRGAFFRFAIKKNGVLIMDLRPYVDVYGIPCFKDLVTGENLYNLGTGTLTYTEREESMGLIFGGSDDEPILPSARGFELTIPASGETITAPANGWVYFSTKVPSVNCRVCLMNKGTYKHMKFSQYSSADRQLISIYVPCKKGDEIAPLYNNLGELEWFAFIYAD